MNWRNGGRLLRRVQEDADDDNDDEDDGNDKDDDRGDDEGVVLRNTPDFAKLGLPSPRSFERETRCSERFPRRRGRLDKAEEAE
ncbi:PREDICTED: putative uncharacterized protein DDB_G0270496 [Dinoponera quadriceps]|uniref:Uncharacterized protein n=1 Tax=Dinoponera quadriceps TaxID=609295 RepID=A0A6P3X1I4_DINQU|nr:PREDICTED: putative uncharacterized protein DDB_G0270496 [Dinoponera quadriceps]